MSLFDAAAKLATRVDFDIEGNQLSPTRRAAGLTTFGRPAYAHLLCFSRAKRLEKAESFADVLPRLGEMTWARAMGLEACDAISQFLVKFTKTRVVVDPFCGVGTMLASANEHGLDAIGVELSAKRADKARALSVSRPPSEHNR